MDAKLVAEAKEASGNGRSQYEDDNQQALQPMLSGSVICPDEADESPVVDSTINEDKTTLENSQNVIGVFEDPSLNCAAKTECAFSLVSSPGFQESMELVSATQETQQEVDTGLKHYQVQAVEEGDAFYASTSSIAERELDNLNGEVGNQRTDESVEILRDTNKDVSDKLSNSDVTVGTRGKALQKKSRKCVAEEPAGGNGGVGSLNCSLKIEVIDGTALIELPEIANYGNSKKNCLDVKHEKKRSRAGRNYHKIEAANKCERVEKFCKLMYTKKDMEALRFMNVKGQKKLWQQVYNGLEPSVRKEYTELGSFRQQKNGHLDSRHAAAKSTNSNSIVGLAAAQRGGNYLNNFVDRGVPVAYC